jgi:predicted nicotinamide N-methyase
VSADVRRRVETIRIGDLALRVELVERLDDLLEHYARECPADTDMIPYYAQVWPAGLALADYLHRLGDALRGVRFIELGCGMAIPSLVAARHGARVLATDFHPDTEAYVRRNAALNGLDGLAYRRFDWCAEDLGERFDLVVGSDLLYEARHAGPLARAVARLCGPEGRAVLADPGRDALAGAVARFENEGFRNELVVMDNLYVIELRRGN